MNTFLAWLLAPYHRWQAARRRDRALYHIIYELKSFDEPAREAAAAMYALYNAVASLEHDKRSPAETTGEGDEQA